MDDTATPTQTEPLTAQQAHVLNDLANACADLRKCLADVIATSTRHLEKATAGLWLDGFSGDLFGQNRYQADAAAVKREALIRTAHVAGAPAEAITVAVLPATFRGAIGGAHYFDAGDTFPVATEDEAAGS